MELDEPFIFIPEDRFDIELCATKNAKISLNKPEWKILCRFMKKHELEMAKMKPEKYEHMPEKVKLVIEDWLLTQK